MVGWLVGWLDGWMDGWLVGCWAYLELLVITRTDKTVVSVTKLPFLGLDMFTFLCNKLNLIVFFT